ncbi:uncharacterized protein ACBT44_008387 isoform 1-T1 [Syngnathus typhle]
MLHLLSLIGQTAVGCRHHVHHYHGSLNFGSRTASAFHQPSQNLVFLLIAFQKTLERRQQLICISARLRCEAVQMWVLDMQAVIRSMERKLNASLEKYPHRGYSPDNMTATAKTNGLSSLRPGRPLGGGRIQNCFH